MAITATERLQIEKLLVLMFNAAPGADYLGQVVGLYEALGHNLQGAAEALDDIPAFQSLHPNFQTGAEFAADFLTPFALQNDATARDFVIAKINAGVSKGDIAFQALQVLTNLPAQASVQYQNAKAILENKAAVADYYSAIKGISQSDVAVLQTVLNGITADPATVTNAEAEIDAGTRGVDGLNVTLSPTQDTVHGTNAGDSIHGIFGGADATYTAGDSIDGAGGTDRLMLTATGTTSAPGVIVKNVEFIAIQDTAGATFNALLVENNPAISFGSTLAGQTSKVVNAALASTVGLAGKGNLTVDYASTGGASDTANIALSGAGTSASAKSTVDVGDTDTVEAVNIAASGTNFVNLLAGTAVGTVTLTGNGTNTFTLGSIKGTSTIDASASTGTNTFDVGTGLSNGDVIKGGTGADTVKFATASALGVITLDGVETLSGKVDADIAMNLGTSTGLKTLTLAGGSGSLDVSSAPGTLATVNYQSVASGDIDNSFGLSYAKGQTGSVTLNLGSAASTTGFELHGLSFTRAAGVAVNVLGAQDISFSSFTLDDTTKSVAIGLADGSDFGHTNIIDTQGTASALQTVTVTVGDDASLDTALHAGGAQGVAVNATVGDDSFSNFTLASVKSVGDATFEVGENSQGKLYLDPAKADLGGDIGDVTVSYGSGANGEVRLGANGDIGDLHLDLASGAMVDFYNDTGDLGWTRDIGDVSLDVDKGGTGNLNLTAMALPGDDGKWAQGGNVGDVSVHAHGKDAWAFASILADSAYSGGGGNIGNIDVGASGGGARFEGGFNASGGSIGDIVLHLDDTAYGNITAGESTTANATVSVGNVQLFLADETRVVGGFEARGDVGKLSIEAGDGVQAATSLVSAKADLGDATATFGDGALWNANFIATEGKVGALAFSAGEDATINIMAISEKGSFGALEGTAGARANLYITLDGNPGAKTTAGDITFTGGDADSYAQLWVSGGTVGVIDLHGWLGIAEIHADGVLQGTTIMGASLANSIDGTQGADLITGGPLDDSLHGNGGADTIMAGAGNDNLQGGAGADILSGGGGDDMLVGGADGDVIDGGAGNDVIFGEQGVDALTGGAGVDMFAFPAITLGTSLVGIAAATVTDVITDFVSGTDKLGFNAVGSATNYAENLTPASGLLALLTDANDKLDGTFQYYFGVFGGNGYLVHSTDGLTTDCVIQLSGLSNMDFTDITLPPF